MPSSRCVVALLEPPQALVVRPCANSASITRGWVGPFAWMKASTSAARFFVVGLHLRCGDARMHQRQVLPRQEAVVDEAVLLDREPGVAALEVAGAIAGDAMAQRQVLGARRRADRVGLDEAQLFDRP